MFLLLLLSLSFKDSDKKLTLLSKVRVEAFHGPCQIKWIEIVCNGKKFGNII